MTAYIFVPGYGNSLGEHWQQQWRQHLPSHWAELGSAPMSNEPKRTNSGDWDHPDCELWVARLNACIDAIEEPIVLIGHSLGVLTIAHWAAAHPQSNSKINAAWLVAAPDAQRPDFPSAITGYASTPLAPLPFPSLVVISSNDPYAKLDRSVQLAHAWQTEIWRLENAGHINTSSGYGPWPEGLAKMQDWLKNKCKTP